jgi:hypothetical protein
VCSSEERGEGERLDEEKIKEEETFELGVQF